MAGYTYRAGNTLSTDAGTFTSYTRDIVGTGIVKFEESCATGNTVITVAVDVSAVKAFGLKSTVAATVTVNDDGTPDATIALTANVPVVWVSGASQQFPSSNPLGSVDVTSVKVNVAGATTGTVSFACLTDSTP